MKTKPIDRKLLTSEFVERFWSRVQKHGEPGTRPDCWIWTMGKNDKGYGVTGLLRQLGAWYAHRVAYVIHNGRDLNPTAELCHHCDVPFCVNPAHLFEGTHRDNMLDMLAKGKHNMARKTHCPSGHPYSAENIRASSKGKRGCKVCHAASERFRRAKAFLSQASLTG